MATSRFAVHVFLKNFLNPLNYLQPPISDSSPLACYSWWMSTPKQIAANRLNAQRPAGPRPAQGKAAARASSLKTELYARSQVIALEPPPEAKANFLQPQSNQQKIGFVPSFCPTPEPDGAEPLPLAPEGPSRRCWNPSGDCTDEA